MTTSAQHRLQLSALELRIRLGCSKEEQSLPQVVLVDIDLNFPKPPLACQSDDLQETVCYAKLATRIERVAMEKAYHLIEHLAWRIFESLREELSSHRGLQLSLRVRKKNLPISLRTDGAIYTIEDTLS
jgi:dihydroneopterin aldolase